jgi:drug/metabolite transporter (DMT)-like permease
LLFAAAVGLAGNYALYMLGLERAGAATTQVLIQVAPLFLILLGIFWLRERPRPRQLAGAFVALTGLFLVSWASGRTDNVLAGQKALGVAFVVGSALSWGFYAAVHKRLGESHASGTTMMWIFLMASALLAPTMALEPARSPDGIQMAATAYLCVNTIVAYWCFAEALRHADATIIAVITTLGPIVTLLLLALNNHLGWTRIGYEELTAGKLAGAALVLGGVVLAITGRRVR